LVAELAARGIVIRTTESEMEREGPQDTLSRFHRVSALWDALGAPLDTSIALLQALRRKFPADDADALLEAAEILWPAWARFEDWMGAVSLLRAVPRQRTLGVRDFAERMARWLENEEDLFEALGRFARAEGAGQRPVGEVLGLLGGGDPLSGPPRIEEPL
jgi:hypothetical protein